MADEKKKPGRPPAIPMHERPEFKAAVAEAAAMTVKQLIAAGAVPQAQGSDAATELFSKMALSIAEISDQGTQRKRVAPEILAARDAARRRAEARVILARENGEKPEYKVIAKIYFNERFIEPFRLNDAKKPVPNEIIWTGMPNQALVPLNEVAKEIFAHYEASIASGGKLATTDNRSVWVTSSGLVVKGDAPARRFVADPQEFRDDLQVHSSPNDPTAPEVRVLGTVAAPARQNIQPGA